MRYRIDFSFGYVEMNFNNYLECYEFFRASGRDSKEFTISEMEQTEHKIINNNYTDDIDLYFHCSKCGANLSESCRCGEE